MRVDRPISPDEVAKMKVLSIPAEVIRVFNKLIVENYRNGCSVVLQRDVVERILGDCDIVTTAQQIYDNHWLDIESSYEEVGWRVEYDKPAYNEGYDASFKFTRHPNFVKGKENE